MEAITKTVSDVGSVESFLTTASPVMVRVEMYFVKIVILKILALKVLKLLVELIQLSSNQV